MRSNRSRHVLTVLCCVLLAASGCGGGGDDDTEPAAVVTKDAAAPDPGAAPSDEDADADEEPEESTGLERGSADDRPQYNPVEIELPRDETFENRISRYREGYRAQLHGIRYTADSIEVDIDFVNNAAVDIEVSMGCRSEDPRLLMIDDRGNYYELSWDEADGCIETLAPGESLSGSLSFAGPVDAHADYVMFGINIQTADLEADATSWDGTYAPADEAFELGGGNRPTTMFAIILDWP